MAGTGGTGGTGGTDPGFRCDGSSLFAVGSWSGSCVTARSHRPVACAVSAQHALLSFSDAVDKNSITNPCERLFKAVNGRERL
jgi:hypothetical protein